MSEASTKIGRQTALAAMAANILLAGVKISAGALGRSYALVADGIESCADLFSTLLVWSGLKVAGRPPDRNHPFGHGKAESLAGLVAGLLLFVAAAFIAFNSLQEILHPHAGPAPWTLGVLVLVIAAKEGLYRGVLNTARRIHSTSLESDAVHHRSDAITSLATFVGISVALIGGKGWEAADDWAALLACILIVRNGMGIVRRALAEVMDESVPDELVEEVRQIAAGQGAVLAVEKCRVRKSGLGLWMDIHVWVDGNMSVREGHRISHAVSDALRESRLPIDDVVVHIEPAAEGRID
jgi:cation diffusion facilitator family transporter